MSFSNTLYIKSCLDIKMLQICLFKKICFKMMFTSQSHWRMNMGNSFHNLGAAFWKARSP